MPDAAAAIAVGLLLAYIAFRIGRDSRMLLLGLGAPPQDVALLERTPRRHPEVKDVLELRTMYIGPRLLLVAARVDFVEGIDADRVEEVAGDLRDELTNFVPEASDVFLDAARRSRSPAQRLETSRDDSRSGDHRERAAARTTESPSAEVRDR